MTARTQGPASSGEDLPADPGQPVGADWRARLRASRAGTLGVLAVQDISREIIFPKDVLRFKKRD